MFWENKVIVITGGSSGLGKELAQAFGKAGGKVVIAALEPEIVDAAVTELQQEGIDCSGIACNVTSDEDSRVSFWTNTAKLTSWSTLREELIAARCWTGRRTSSRRS